MQLLLQGFELAYPWPLEVWVKVQMEAAGHFFFSTTSSIPHLKGLLTLTKTCALAALGPKNVDIGDIFCPKKGDPVKRPWQ